MTHTLNAADLNTSCHCIHVGRDQAAVSLPAEMGGAPFASEPVFINRQDREAMEAVVEVIEALAASPRWQEAALAQAPEIARHDPGHPGVMFGYDFHIGQEGPRLIEVNTNAGGLLMLGGLAGGSQRWCSSVGGLLEVGGDQESLESRIVEMFVEEWRLAGRPGSPGRIAIVDEAPEAQFLHPEFLRFAAVLRRAGIEAEIAAPEALSLGSGGEVMLGGRAVDMVYNRLTDFYLEGEVLAPLRAAWLGGRVVLSPHPRAHALMARKSNLIAWSDAARLESLGLDPARAALLSKHVPETVAVGSEDEALWARRRDLFFKPVDGFGSRAAWSGEGLTRKTFARILQGGYVAQRLVEPGRRALDDGTRRAEMKYDVRLFTYRGEVLGSFARLYRGQTTNMRTPMGGFAPLVEV